MFTSLTCYYDELITFHFLDRRDAIPLYLDILIVDDSPPILKMTSMMLKRIGHHIVTADDGCVFVSTFCFCYS